VSSLENGSRGARVHEQPLGLEDWKMKQQREPDNEDVPGGGGYAAALVWTTIL
jgi:hypothetical protein